MVKKPSPYFKKLNGCIKCSVCPRECVLKESQKGFCQVRVNEKGRLTSLNYGLSTHFVIEPIETNGVFHYLPGENTLAVGTVGCNLNCKYCQAWRYSKLKDLNQEFFKVITPEQLVTEAEKLGVKVISWTFNDPMNWVEFVIESAKLAKSEGIVSLFKSNHFMTKNVAKELVKHVDIFSVSLKSIREDFYKNVSNGSLKPILEIAKFIRSKNKHIEVSNLIVPGLNSSEEQIKKLSIWVRKNLGPETPLHFARFHPDYLMKDKKRTPIKMVEAARRTAIDQGLKYAYTGNLIHNKGLNTYCPECGKLLIERENGFIKVHNKGSCDRCNYNIPIIFKDLKKESFRTKQKSFLNSRTYEWKKEIWSVDLQVKNELSTDQTIWIVYYAKDRKNILREAVKVSAGEELRITINEKGKENKGVRILYPPNCKTKIFENLDRSYYGFKKWGR